MGTEVIAFIDDCGHTVVVDVTGPRQNLKIAVEILQDIIDRKYPLPYSKDDSKENLARCLVGTGQTLLGNKAADGMLKQQSEIIWDFINECDYNIGTRDGFEPTIALSSWPSNCVE